MRYVLTTLCLTFLTGVTHADSDMDSRGYKIVFMDASPVQQAVPPPVIKHLFDTVLDTSVVCGPDPATPGAYEMVELDLVYLNRLPPGVTQELARQVLLGKPAATKKARTLLASFRDKGVEEGLDGMLIYYQTKTTAELTAISTGLPSYRKKAVVPLAETGLTQSALSTLLCATLKNLPVIS